MKTRNEIKMRQVEALRYQKQTKYTIRHNGVAVETVTGKLAAIKAAKSYLQNGNVSLKNHKMNIAINL